MFHPVSPVVVELLIQASPFEEVEFVVGVGVAVEDEPILEGVADLPGGDVVVGDGAGLLVGPYAGQVVGFPRYLLVSGGGGGYVPVPAVLVEVV